MRKRIRLLSLCLIVVMLLGALSGCKAKRMKETEETTYGIDVARYQGTIDWQQVAASKARVGRPAGLRCQSSESRGLPHPGPGSRGTPTVSTGPGSWRCTQETCPPHPQLPTCLNLSGHKAPLSI